MATMTKPKQWVEKDAADGYHAQDIEDLLIHIEEGAIVIIKNAHLLTAKAFYLLYEFLLGQNTKGLHFILVSKEPEKIFPPILEYVELAA